MTTFVTPQSADIGSVAAIPNALATAELDTAILTDPAKVQAFKSSVADQMNAQSGGPKFTDLSQRIGSIKIQDSAQGASILTVPVIDPMWALLLPDKNGNAFIQVDENGYLWPPIDVNFPTGTDCVWRLCQVRAVWEAEMSEPNLTLTFEDRIASLMREMSPVNGLAQGLPNQTLGGFIKMLVDNANHVLGLRGRDQIRLVELIDPADPNYTVPINQLPSSAQGPLRKNPNKDSGGASKAHQQALKRVQDAVSGVMGASTNSISTVENGVTALLGGNTTPAGQTLPPGYVPGVGWGS